MLLHVYRMPIQSTFATKKSFYIKQSQTKLMYNVINEKNETNKNNFYSTLVSD